ncbi:RNA-binding S4 domain-containing protein [Brevibacterium sp. 50QC2O2]|mgnify:CR=1 FL=1|uniref:RNA-binding S4 domain-containing protein n=1 Tax=unclassified Brevibacterium TaxID=2614124 RepID=UPI00211D0CB3|nr:MULTISPECIES: RNA-binding S4 domain-containing protein [unclassified Brevibacterium]MCQ9367748.1 RNA-binding S4 domain-containing protein [Brevibacterium sp. 91QC2O2]MCQ9388007.1 RNA-binding S4 domain-containing protein [Brevibacterium sp. 50QC2O2]
MPELNFDPAATQRIDLWLWCVRICKTRSAAQAALKSGHVQIDGVKVKPAQKVRIGQEVRVRRPGAERVLVVQGFLDTRGPAPMAQACYLDHSPAPSPLLRAALPKRDPGTGRPTKKDRRELDRLRGRDSH